MSTRSTIPRFMQFSRTAVRSHASPFRNPPRCRYQSTEVPLAEPAQNPLKRLWNSPVGAKTVHFWAPVMKWSIVLAGISDFWRPVENLSLTQNLALTATGAIWTRWCFIIKPRNILLAAVNFFLGCVGVIQVSRILVHRRNSPSVPELIREKASNAKETVQKAID